MPSALPVPALKEKAAWVRKEVLEAIAAKGKGHIGGTYSCTDILVALYYGGALNVDLQNLKKPDRDRFILSKGHACLALYSIYLDRGVFTRAKFDEYGRDGGALGGQLDLGIPGAEYNTGSLGHALGIGCGMALAAKMDQKDYRTYVLMGDAECLEGSVWEAVIFAAEHGLNNLVGIIDRNRLSVTDVLDDEHLFGNFCEKLRLFGWNIRTVDGHSFPDILAVLDEARRSDKPFMILADTIKGKGISFMENGVKWHHSVPNADELARARAELAKGGV